RAMVRLPVDGFLPRLGAEFAASATRRAPRRRLSAPTRKDVPALPPRPSDDYSAAAAARGRRPRRAAARPGISPAQSSQRSATFEPRRASVYVTRIAAPLFSPTSLPHLSQTSTVLRATEIPPSTTSRRCGVNQK